jgi:hypothetical protein
MFLRSLFVLILFSPVVARADVFDRYFNKHLADAAKSKNVQKVTKLTPKMMLANSRALPGISAAFIVVKTNGNRWAKLLVHPAETKDMPIVVVERYVTFREGEERAVLASGQKLHLFEDFRFSLDMGQVVPKKLDADLRVGVDQDGGVFLEPIEKAELYLVTKHLPEANPPKSGKLTVGDKFEIHYFNGTYKLYDDGRRSGTLQLKVDESGAVTGHFFSDKDGVKYVVDGKINKDMKNQIEFVITYPRTVQNFTGYLFTGDGKALTGYSRLENRETGFYATRVEDEK